MTGAVFGFPESREPAEQLAQDLGVAFDTVSVRAFPDGESLVRVPKASGIVLLYRSLDNPNAKLVELLLAAAALRENGARQVMLVAPYLAYMRQDMAFHPGEAISQQVIGGLLATHFDGLLTLDPHLHRIASLSQAVRGIPALAISAAPALAAAIDRADRPILVGPDSESQPWVEAIAGPLGLDYLLGEKQRQGDRAVDLAITGVERAAGRRVVLVDDVISSGETMIVATHKLLAAGAAHVEALATHCLAGADDLARMKRAGIARIRATTTVDGPTACLPVAGLIAAAIRKAGWLVGV